MHSLSIFRTSALGACLTLSACASLKLQLVDAAHRRPSNVAVFFTVDTNRGQPVGGLQAENFRIYEDDRLVSANESKQTIVNQEVAVEHYTLLLVDMSGSVTESDQVPLIQEAAQSFTSTLQRHQRVAVYAFDGSKDIQPISPFSQSAGVARLTGYKARDPSTNLHGAIVQGIEVLNKALAQAKTSLRFGTLVVFTDGTDHAARVSSDDMMQSIDGSSVDLFAIGVGNEIDEDTLAKIGRSGYVKVHESSAIQNAFEAISQSIIEATQRYYLLSYCSPARAGVHHVTIEAVKGKVTGQLDYEFDAAGFDQGCNPQTPPPFKTTGRVQGRVSPQPARGSRIEIKADVNINAQ